MVLDPGVRALIRVCGLPPKAADEFGDISGELFEIALIVLESFDHAVAAGLADGTEVEPVGSAESRKDGTPAFARPVTPLSAEAAAALSVLTAVASGVTVVTISFTVVPCVALLVAAAVVFVVHFDKSLKFHLFPSSVGLLPSYRARSSSMVSRVPFSAATHAARSSPPVVVSS